MLLLDKTRKSRFCHEHSKISFTLQKDPVPRTMNDRTTRYSDREIINRWAIAGINPAISRILSTRGPTRPAADRCIGFFYVDHEEGITFRIHMLCRLEQGKPPEIITHFEDHGEGLVLHVDEIGAYTLLSNEEANSLSLLEEQRWRIYYESESLRTIRNRVDLDRFRASGYFDDVSAILLSKDRETIPEGVWVRLEEQSADGGSFQGVLLNEPYSDFGIHEGETVTVRFAEDEGGRILVAEAGA